MGWKEEFRKHIQNMHSKKCFKKNARQRVFYKDWKGNWRWDPLYYYETPRMFDAPYLMTLGINNNGIPFVRYQLLPADIHGHRVNVVWYDIEVNPDGSRIKIPSNHFHCTKCKLMGSTETMKMYHCVELPNYRLIGYRRDNYIPTDDDFSKYSSIRTEDGWYHRAILWDDLKHTFYLERKWRLS